MPRNRYGSGWFLVDREFGRLVQPCVSFYARVFGERMEAFEEFLRSARSFCLCDCGSAGRLPLTAMLLRAGAFLRDSGLGESANVLPQRDLYRVSLTGDARGGRTASLRSRRRQRHAGDGPCPPDPVARVPHIGFGDPRW
jgi:hypothetical protein